MLAYKFISILSNTITLIWIETILIVFFFQPLYRFILLVFNHYFIRKSTFNGNKRVSI